MTHGSQKRRLAQNITFSAYVDHSEIADMDWRPDHDQETEILTIGSYFFAIGDEYDDGEHAGYSWAWGTILSEDDEQAWDYHGEDGGTTEAEARAAVDQWIHVYAR